MRPALQRLLSRPSSLDLLRCLVGVPTPLCAPSTAIGTRRCRRESKSRNYSTAAVAVQDEDVFVPAEIEKVVRNEEEENPRRDLKIYRVPSRLDTAPTETLNGKPFLSTGYYGQWKNASIWRTEEEIDFQSNLALSPWDQRLLDLPAHEHDLRLFARLLDHRERRYGMEGLRMYWEAVKQRRIHLPTRDYREAKNVGLTAEKLWVSFLTLGFYDNIVLEELCDYADKLLEKTGRRWSRLYATIVQHFLVKGHGKEAVKWHNRLYERHPPTAQSFASLCHQTVHNRGDLKALEEIYDGNEHRNVYGKIVSTLAWQEDFKSAMKWHFKLVEKGDIPKKPQHAETLSRFLAIYDRPNAVRVTKSLVAAGHRFSIPTTFNTSNVKISREIMNLVHGKTFNIPVKAYNDEYGARWFATSWVPLDLAMHSIHALGIQEIGPLSLQALCLRKEHNGAEPTPYAILHRIERLENIGISIGNSVFSRAVKHFAQNRMFNYLKGLLNSDQHPESLEDWKHMEALMASYAQIRDWEQYRRLLAIRTIGSKAPTTEAQNVWLRTQITNGDLPAALDILAKMQINGTVVKMGTIAYIIQNILGRRQRGHRPVPLKGGYRDIDMAISILKGIMDAGNLVPAAYWREIVRRLGMLGRQRDLHELCIFLATRYGPDDKSFLRHVGAKRLGSYRVPAQVETSHPLHPLKILFPVSLQKAIVEWGFINAMRIRQVFPWHSKDLIAKEGINCQFTAGITLLRYLRQHGVDIDENAMESAIFNRLITYYSPGRSNRLKNRVAQTYAPNLGLMKRQIDEAMGRKTFIDRGLKQLIVSRGITRLLRRGRKERVRRVRMLSKRTVSSSRALH